MIKSLPALTLALAFVFCAGPARADSPLPANPELLNGDFTAGPDSGWTLARRDFAGSSEIKPLPDGGITARKVMCGYARLAQRVDLPDLRRLFTTSIRTRASVNSPGYHGYAALVLGWLDADGNLLGETRWYTRSGRYAPRANGNHRATELPTSSGWHDIELDIADELRKFTGFTPASVRGMTIAYEAFGSGTSAC
ncbi:hypothetical protein JXB37_02435 [candidate division WOR-3 bacterium]|nr:hypothetical protein [candidate division WOR-3 bacterium]